MNKTRLDENGYQQLLQEIERVKNAINATIQENVTNKKVRESTTAEAIAQNAIAVLSSTYVQLCQIRDNCEIISAPEKASEPMAQTGDVIEIILGSNGMTRNMTVILVSSLGEKIEGVAKVPLSSPLGRAIYGKKIGDTDTYQDDNRTYTFEIKNIVKQELTERKGLN